MDEFLILLQAKLDEVKSKENVNTDIDKIQSQIDKLKIQAEIDPKAISNLVKQLETVLNQKINISNIGINQSQVIKSAEQTGQQIGNAINQGIANTTSKVNNTLKSFTDLRNFSELNRSISNIRIDSSELKNYKSILDNVKNTYAEFGQVRITNEIFKDGVLEKFKVNIEQVNGDLKETKSFIMELNDENNAFVFSGLINGSENIVQHLDKTKNVVNQTADAINALKEKAQIDEIQLSMEGKNITSKNYDYQIDTEIRKLKDLGFTDEEVAQKVSILTDAQANLKKVMNSTEFDSVISKNQAIIEADNERTIALNQVRTAYGQLKTDVSQYYNLNKQTKLSTDIQNWLSKNSRASKEAKQSLQEYYRELSSGRVSVDRLNYIEKELKTIDAQQRGLGRLGKSLTDQFKQAGESFTQWLSVSSGIMFLISKTKDAVSELVELDNILTEISKTSDLTERQLRNLGDSAFETASKYGRTASDYLIGVQEMYRAGFDNAEEMAELSMLAQAAGDMESNSANDYLMATNAAYDFKGSVEKLNKVLDSQNYITNNAAVSMQDMADATSEAASIAAQYGVEIDELSALIAVATSKTRESGSEVGTALKSIFVTLQDTTSKPVVDAFNSVGISMTKIVDGSERLKTPIELLKELAVAFNELPEGDTKRANILTDIGKKYHANTLSAILSDWDSYESMLDLYSQGMGSAAKEAEKSANNIQGSLNRLHNTWTDTVENVANSDTILTIVNGFNGFLSVVNKATDALGSLGTIGLGAGIFAGVKNTGKRHTSVWISDKSFVFCLNMPLMTEILINARSV